ncbi:hypothetical protein [Cystobacter fuscus]|uniref:hypothetical protein n=1 Tax=Cystobacter fuscus TaxID=43 RepID=UPI002B2E490F|nr:hypothetical protein F0U63_05700 [Cystobacter fuscus]
MSGRTPLATSSFSFALRTTQPGTLLSRVSIESQSTGTNTSTIGVIVWQDAQLRECTVSMSGEAETTAVRVDGGIVRIVDSDFKAVSKTGPGRGVYVMGAFVEVHRSTIFAVRTESGSTRVAHGVEILGHELLVFDSALSGSHAALVSTDGGFPYAPKVEVRNSRLTRMSPPGPAVTATSSIRILGGELYGSVSGNVTCANSVTYLFAPLDRACKELP